MSKLQEALRFILQLAIFWTVISYYLEGAQKNQMHFCRDDCDLSRNSGQDIYLLSLSFSVCEVGII